MVRAWQPTQDDENRTGAYAVMQTDGNFVVYTADGQQARWSSGTTCLSNQFFPQNEILGVFVACAKVSFGNWPATSASRSASGANAKCSKSAIKMSFRYFFLDLFADRKYVTFSSSIRASPMQESRSWPSNQATDDACAARRSYAPW
jgi:hypothetical protein